MQSVQALLCSACRSLTALLRRHSATSLCIWYDAVTVDGQLKWQDTLNDKNAAFFEACDGIFCNYCWKEVGWIDLWQIPHCT